MGAKAGSLRGVVVPAVVCLLAAAGPVPTATAGGVKAWPLVYLDQDEVSQETRTELLWPLYVRQTTPAYSANELLSVPQTYPPQFPHQYYFVWPLSGLRLAPAAHDAWLFPFLWSGRGPDRAYNVLFPAVFFFRQKDETRLNLGGLCHNYWDEDEQRHYLFPLLWASWEDTPSRQASRWAVVPLFWYARDQGDRDWAGPDGMQHRRTWQSRDTWLTLAGWGDDHTEETPAGTTSDSSYRALFPLYHQGESVHSDTIARTRAESSHLWLFPYNQSEGTTRRPAAAGADTTPDAGEVLSTTSRHLVLPVYFDFSSLQASPPSPTPGSSFTLRLDHDTWALLYWRSEDETRQRDGTRLSLDLARGVFPLYWDFRNAPADGPREQATYFIPLGAYLYKENDFESRNLLGPGFTRTVSARDSYTRYDVLFPLFMAKYGSEVSGGRLFPLSGWEEWKGRYAHCWFLFPFGWNYESQPDTPAVRRDAERWRLDQLESRRAPAEAQDRCPEVEAQASRLLAFFPFFWSARDDDRARTGVMPLYARQFTSRPPEYRSDTWWWPLLLGQTSSWGLNLDSHRQDWLLSALAWGDGEEFRLRRAFPFWSDCRKGGSRWVWSWLPPFAYRSWEAPSPGGLDLEQHRRLAVPFAWLPWYRSEARQNGAESATWTRFFPFFAAGRDSAEDSSRLSILWPLVDARWQHGETRVDGLGGIVNHYERDANGFVDRRLLYRLYRRRTRSWAEDLELMPFFSRSWRADGTGGWSILGGLVGAGHERDRSYLRLLYLPIRTGPGVPASADAVSPDGHAELALRYLEAERHDRAAIEFTLAGEARRDDRNFQLAAGAAYLRARPEGLEPDLRAALPDSLREFSQKTAVFNADGIRRRFRQLALARFERALALGADPRTVKRDMARCRHDLGELPACRALLEDILRDHGGGLPAALDLLAVSADARPTSEAERQQAVDLAARLHEQFPASPTVLLFLAWSRQQRVAGATGEGRRGPPPGTPVPTEARTELEQAIFLDPAPDEQAWLRQLGEAARQRRDHWLLPASNAVGLAPWNAYTPAFAAVQRLPFFPVAPVPLSGSTAKAAPSAAVNENATRTIRIASRLAALAGENPNLRERPDAMLRTLDAGTPARWQRRDYVTELIRAYEATLAGTGPAGRGLLESHLRRLRFGQSYLTAWQVALEPTGAAIHPAEAKRLEVAGPYVDLDAALGRPDHCTGHAQTRLTVPTERDAILWLGFDRELTAELNGLPVFGPTRAKVPLRDEFRVPLHLKAGENVLRLTVKDDRLCYGFYARLSDPAGDYMPDVAAAAP